MLIVSGAPDPDSGPPSKSLLTHVPCLPQNVLGTELGECYFAHKQHILIPTDSFKICVY
jgi:hypothetical protein